ncbi:hypothetical protein GQ53DRAFT_636608 [Thozetella sp. PMI_491]|nr:hypothetical protein GQ53DRAFT_636608 [Thozetella sp. PMI_491]
MEDTSNGSLKGPKAANGINGSLKSGLNGHAIGTRRRVKAGPSLLARALNGIARLLTWYSIFTVLFRCPPTLEACDETSPRICRPYFRLKQTVSPHLQPYYETYAAPYVELASPYYQTLDNHVITPGWAYATKHGQPLVTQGQAYSQAQWDKNVQPLLVKYQALAEAKYHETLAPHVERASTAVGPYYDIARTSALQTYHEVLLPTIVYLQPYAHQGYETASAFTTDVAVPSIVWAWNKTYLFLDSTVLPQLRVVYVENVEPQLVKIGQRLGRYSEKKPSQKHVIDSTPGSASKASSSFAKPSPSVSTSSAAPISSEVPVESPPPVSEAPVTTEPVAASSEAPRSRAEPVPAPERDDEDESEVRRIARETVTEDLKDWQERYAKAADEGAAEIESRIEEITKRMVRRNARTTGKSLVEQLQTTVVSELMTLRRHILNIVGAVAKGSASPEEGLEQVTTVVRQAGMSIKQAAQDIRKWREDFEMEMQSSITEAADEHFRILDGIRDLALQKIGMKWAWMEGVTYKDWAKYHLLKDRFDEWQEDIKQLIVTHPGLIVAHDTGADIEDQAMKVAASAAKELGRLKQVAAWKIAASDGSEEFDSDLTRQAAEAAESSKAAAAESAALEAQAAEAASEAPAVATSSADEAVTESSIPEEPVSDVSSSAETVTPEVASSVESEPTTASTEEPSSATEEASASELPEHVLSASEAIEEATSSAPEDPAVSTSTVAEEEPEVTPDLASAPILADPMLENIVSAEDVESPTEIELEPELEEPLVELPIEDVPPSTSTTSVKPAFLGAAAQSVPSRKPILDEQFDELPASLSSMAHSAYSAALSRADKQYTQAISMISAQIRGPPEPAEEKMLASVTSAYSNAIASASVKLESVLRVAQERLHSSASPTKKLLPTALPDINWAQIESIAAERLQQGRNWAEEQYESAKVAIGLATPTPTPSTPGQHMNKALENARHNYYAGLGIAHARYTEFLAAASSAMSSLTATPTPTPTDVAGSLSSVASVASESAASVASAAAEKLADTWEVLVTKISVQVYGAPTPTPWYESVYSAAGEYASSAASVAAEAVSYATAAPKEADRQYEAVHSIVSELLVGKEQTFVESVYSRLSAAYAASTDSIQSIAGDAHEAVKTAGEKAAHIKDEL